MGEYAAYMWGSSLERGRSGSVHPGYDQVALGCPPCGSPALPVIGSACPVSCLGAHIVPWALVGLWLQALALPGPL
jgi:hypothetical protein